MAVRLGRVLDGQADVFDDKVRIGKARRSLRGYGWDALDTLDRLVAWMPTRSEAASALYEKHQKETGTT